MPIVKSADLTSVAKALPTEVENFGRGKLSDFYDNWVIYRDLAPLDKRLPPLRAIASKIGINSKPVPRKKEKAYALAANWYIHKLQEVRGRSEPLEELLFIGDSFYNDGYAYQHIVDVSDLKGTCFIGGEESESDPQIEVHQDEGFYLSNRWAALGSWAGWALEQGFKLGNQTAVIVDIDKTAIGAKGRNDTIIDRARLEGIYRTMSSLLGKNFDSDAFERQYAQLNNAEYHCITADNQDYIAYICLMLNAKLIQFDELDNEVQNGSIDNFEQFTRWANSRMMISPTGGEQLRQVHETIMAAVNNGDQTPFKRFRRQEFIATAERMGNLDDDSSIFDLLQGEVTITNEVGEIAAWLRDRGCLLLCLSDKPKEASCPDPHESADMLPVHEAETHLVGTTIKPMLDLLT